MRDMAQRDQRRTGGSSIRRLLEGLQRVAEERLPGQKFDIWAKPDVSEVTADHRGQGQPRHSTRLKQSSYMLENCILGAK